MSTTELRPLNGFGLWLIVSMGVVMGAALFSAPREKPPLVFAAGFGAVTGVLFRVLARQLAVPLHRRVTISTILLTAVGFAVCQGQGYRLMAMQWQKLQPAGSDNPLAAALLQSFPNSDPHAIITTQQQFTFADYLSRRVPDWPSPWPTALCGAEWMLCVMMAGICVGIRPCREPQRPVADVRGSERTTPL